MYKRQAVKSICKQGCVIPDDFTSSGDFSELTGRCYYEGKYGSCLLYTSHTMSIGDTGSMLYIATVNEEDPSRLTSEPVLLSRPLFGWENVNGTINNEGPYTFVKEDTIYLTYSGGAANSYTYVLGLFTAKMRCV